jgi:hypothetical protein
VSKFEIEGIGSIDPRHTNGDDRRQVGRAVRKLVPRTALGEWAAPSDRPDLVDLLEEQNAPSLQAFTADVATSLKLELGDAAADILTETDVCVMLEDGHKNGRASNLVASDILDWLQQNDDPDGDDDRWGGGGSGPATSEAVYDEDDDREVTLGGGMNERDAADEEDDQGPAEDEDARPALNLEEDKQFIQSETVAKEVKLMRVRGQRHGASLPRGHEEVKSSMHANIDGFREQMLKGVDVIKFNQGNLQTGSRTLQLNDEFDTLTCKNKKKIMGFSKEQYDMATLVRVQKGELPDASLELDGKWTLGTATLRSHVQKGTAKAMVESGLCFSLIFPDRR